MDGSWILEPVFHAFKRCKLQLQSIVDNKQGDHEGSLEEIWSKVGKCRNLISCIQMIQRVANGVAKAPVHFPVLNTLPSHDGWKTTHYFPLGKSIGAREGILRYV